MLILKGLLSRENPQNTTKQGDCQLIHFKRFSRIREKRSQK